MPVPVADRAANKYELIEHAAETLNRSVHKKKVFSKIYSGKTKAKTVPDLMKATGLPRNRVLDAGMQLARNELVTQIKVDGMTAYEKIDFFQQHRDKILRFAENAAARQQIPTKRKNLNANRRTIRLNYDFRVPSQKVVALH